ncbi:hypothetical protein K503DRAFT_734746 [Rhizopogon vinicolor AM-OR11-026]|uniref:Amidohydrolase-related domain-containing protein n=1 Tax=Rhizopogon vinicolor AM-OR11-026 TaxID=1314800 RepID=A0A1B7NAJ5_9AGAM|nr:hypothetical protein K503DRAFT_734746 [Rhizopogon vinicolor AM-OR11-026]
MDLPEKGGLPGPPPTTTKGIDTYYTIPYGQQAKRPRHRLLSVVKLATCACFATWICRFALPRLVTPLSSTLKHSGALQDDPASEFADDDFPLRTHEPWDISTDFPYPRTLSYQVTEGTWLRLDVHPVSGDIVFDMAGDVYCLPADTYLGAAEPLILGGRTEAVPVLIGVPLDADPRFSPAGDRLAFKSDAGLGIDNLWVMPWAADGCKAMDVRAHVNSFEQNIDEELLVQGVKETHERKLRRLTREGRADAQRITNETYNWVSDPRWHPSGDKVIATKWYFSSRSLGAGEGWEFPVPPVNAKSLVEVGAGKRIVSKRLPIGWTKEDYVEQQIGHEQFIWAGDDTLIYAGNVKDVDGTYTYSKDVHKGTYSIFRRNLTTGVDETLVDAFPGGASRPTLSRDGRTLAFVRRVRDKEALVLKDLNTGTLHHIWHGLTYDLSTIYAPMGTYPAFAFTPSSSSPGIVIWAAGQIWHVPLARNAEGELVAASKATNNSDLTPKVIPFTANISKKLAETRHVRTDVREFESGPQRVRAFTQLALDEAGDRAVFAGAGQTWVQVLGDSFINPTTLDPMNDENFVGNSKPARRIPHLHPSAGYYSPSLVPGSSFALHARWDNLNFSSLELADLESGQVWEVTGLPKGRWFGAVVSGTVENNARTVVLVKTGGDLLTGNVVATAQTGVWVGEITLPSLSLSLSTGLVELNNLRYVPSSIDPSDVVKLSFVDGEASEVLVQQSDSVLRVSLRDGVAQVVARGKGTSEMIFSPSGSVLSRFSRSNQAAGGAAFVSLFHVHYVPPSSVDSEKEMWAKPGKAPKNLARLSGDGGHDVVFSGDGSLIGWFLGPYLHTLPLSRLASCSSAIETDSSTFGIDCVRGLLDVTAVDVTYIPDMERLSSEARKSIADGAQRSMKEHAVRSNAEVVVIRNATILSMENGSLTQDLREGASVVIRSGVVEAVGGAGVGEGLSEAFIIDAEGGYVVPGFIDAHAHWSGTEDKYPATSWEMQAFLAYGVTTLHNPSLHNSLGYVERGRIESGLMAGPRLFQTGMVIYGASQYQIHQDIASIREAREALIRIKAEAGNASWSYKNYNLPTRAARQRLLTAAREVGMICVPEGGMNYDWDLTYIMDGMTTIEHNIPVSMLYDDILTLYAQSGTGSTPTHIVDYGGVFGEQYLWATEDIPNDPKLRTHVRHDILEGLSESTSRPFNSLALWNVSASVANMVGRGLRAHIGAHGEPPLGLMYHQEMFYAKAGGLSNYEVIRAATADAAITFGLFDSLGSVSEGKLADLVVFPPGFDLLQDDIRHTRNIRYVIRGGRIWDAETMAEVWPIKRKQVLPPFNAE